MRNTSGSFPARQTGYIHSDRPPLGFRFQLEDALCHIGNDTITVRIDLVFRYVSGHIPCKITQHSAPPFGSFSINIDSNYASNFLLVVLFSSSIISLSTAKAWLSGTALEVQFFKLNKLEDSSNTSNSSVPSVIFFKYNISIKYKAPKIFSTFSCFACFNCS